MIKIIKIRAMHSYASLILIYKIIYSFFLNTKEEKWFMHVVWDSQGPEWINAAYEEREKHPHFNKRERRQNKQRKKTRGKIKERKLVKWDEIKLN